MCAKDWYLANMFWRVEITTPTLSGQNLPVARSTTDLLPKFGHIPNLFAFKFWMFNDASSMIMFPHTSTHIGILVYGSFSSSFQPNLRMLNAKTRPPLVVIFDDPAQTWAATRIGCGCGNDHTNQLKKNGCRLSKSTRLQGTKDQYLIWMSYVVTSLWRNSTEWWEF